MTVLIVAWVAAGLVIGSRELLASEAFVDALAPGWIGFTVGALLGILVGIALTVSRVDLGTFFPDLVLSPAAFLYAGVPVGFLTGLIAALTAAARSWYQDRQGARGRSRGQKRGVDNPADPFGWGELHERR